MLLLLTACSPDVTPSAPRALPSDGGVAAPRLARSIHSDGLETLLPNEPGACVAAVRTKPGAWAAQRRKVALPNGLANGRAPLVRFAYRGWSAGAEEPTRLAICAIPDVPAAVAHLTSQLGVARVVRGAPGTRPDPMVASFAARAGVPRTASWQEEGQPMVVVPDGATYVADGAASDPVGSTGVMTTCDPTAIIPEPGCPGYEPVEESFPPESPPPVVGPDFSVTPVPSVIICEARTDNPHFSTTPGFGGRVNVKASNTCDAPLVQMVNVTLTRRQCFFIFCSWPAIASSGPNTSPSPKLTWQSMANAACPVRDTYYAGRSRHESLFPQGWAGTNTWTIGYRLICW